MPTSVALRKNPSRALREGPPWVFRDAVDRPPAIADGTLVEQRAREGQALAIGKVP